MHSRVNSHGVNKLFLVFQNDNWETELCISIYSCMHFLKYMALKASKTTNCLNTQVLFLEDIELKCKENLSAHLS